MFWACCICCNERQVNICCCLVRQLNFCIFRSFTKTLHCHCISRKINSSVFFKFTDKPVRNNTVPVITTKMCITVCSFYFYNFICKFKNRNIKSTATKVINSDCPFFAFVFVKTKCKGSSRRFVDNAFYIKTCNFTSIFCSLTLSVVKISRNCNNGLCNFLTKIIFCSFLHFLQNESTDFLRTKFFLFSILFNLNTTIFAMINDCIR